MVYSMRIQVSYMTNNKPVRATSSHTVATVLTRLSQRQGRLNGCAGCVLQVCDRALRFIGPRGILNIRLIIFIA